MDKLYDEEALTNIQDRLVDPWHKTFAKDVIELYESLKRNKDSGTIKEMVKGHPVMEPAWDQHTKT